MDFIDPEQTIYEDDFEKSLKEDGIEIIIPEKEEKVPEGVGATFKARTTAPSETNPYYIKRGRGGYNPCILISGDSVLPNCVGYAHGRFLEIAGKEKDDRVPVCNAEDWVQVASQNGLKVSTKPKTGATIVWKSGNYWNGEDGCGHVGTVEEVYSDGSILVSQSNYGGTRFFLTKHSAPYNITGQTFVGFIYNPYITGVWRKNDKGWWYEYANGKYPKNKWEKIDGTWYHFDSKGYMQTYWQRIDKKWYFLGDNGKMQTGWIEWKGKWYFCGEDGAMLTGVHTVKTYFNKNGALTRL